MRWTRFLRATGTALLALSLVGCTRKNGTHAEPAPASSEPKAATSAGPPSQVSVGAALYTKYCTLCHGADGTGYMADNAPSLVSHHFLRSATDAFLTEGIRMGRPGTAMPTYGMSRGGPLSDNDIAAIVAFLRSKGPFPVPIPETALTGDSVRGQALFTETCQECHGTSFEKGTTALSLHNKAFLASASPAFLRYAIEHGRPPTRMPAFAGKLSSGQIGDIVVWLRSFAPDDPAAPVANPVVPDDLPVVVNPKGASPKFTLREERYVSAEQVKRALERKERMVIIDARTAADWIQFRIPGAISFPYYDPSHIDRIPKDGTWVVAYCACPHHASGEVVDTLRKANYPKTAVLDEGILVWKNLGYPLEGEAVGKTPAVVPTLAPAHSGH